MRSIASLSLVLLLASPALAQSAQWEWLENAPTVAGRMNDIAAVTPDLLFIVAYPSLYKSTDGGDTWETLGTFEGIDRSLAFVSEQKGWIGTLNGSTEVLYETRDGGQTITNISDRIAGHAPAGICGMHAVDEDVIYAVGDIVGTSHFTRTLDGGLTWESTDMSAHATFLIDVYFFDRMNGFAVGGVEGTPLAGSQAIVLATEDGGATWEERFRTDDESNQSSNGQWGWKISFPTPEVGYVSVQFKERVLKTEDGGQTWTTVPAPLDSMQGLGFLTPSLGWIGGNASPRVTTDGGVTWSMAPVLDGSMNRFRFFGDSLGYAVGRRVYRYRAGSTVAQDTEPLALPEDLEVLPAYPNPFPERVLIPYRLPESAVVKLEVFDVTGRRVGLVERGARPAGPDELLWWARDRSGQPLPPGVYLYRLRAGDATATGRVVKTGER